MSIVPWHNPPYWTGDPKNDAFTFSQRVPEGRRHNFQFDFELFFRRTGYICNFGGLFWYSMELVSLFFRTIRQNVWQSQKALGVDNARLTTCKEQGRQHQRHKPHTALTIITQHATEVTQSGESPIFLCLWLCLCQSLSHAQLINQSRTGTSGRLSWVKVL